MDIFAEFCAEVCKNAPRTTYGEERDLKAELGAHLEDHFEALKLRGVPEDEAALRAVREMGDPAEIGRAINAELSAFWLHVGIAAKLLTVLLIFATITPLFAKIEPVCHNIEARLSPNCDDWPVVYEAADLVEFPCDFYLDVYGGTVRVFGYKLYRTEEYSVLQLECVAYADNPFRASPGLEFLSSFSISEPETFDRGAFLPDSIDSGARYLGPFFMFYSDPERVNVVFEHYGVHHEFELELDWSDVP